MQLKIRDKIVTRGGDPSVGQANQSPNQTPSQGIQATIQGRV